MPNPLEDYVDLLFSFQGSEEATFKSVFTMFKKENGETFMFGRATQSRAELLKMVRHYTAKRQDVYVALGTQKTAEATKPGDPAGKWQKAIRTGGNIKTHKSLFVDIDFGVGHK